MKKISKVESMIEATLPKAIKDLETELGVTFAEFPAIDLSQKLEEDMTGEYNPARNTVNINYELIFLPKGVLNKFLNFANYGQAADLYPILRHELGHFYVDKVQESLKLPHVPSLEQLERLKDLAQGDNFTLFDDPKFQAVVGNKIMNEGIAEYFEHGPLSEREIDQLHWPRYTDVFMKIDEVYYWGHQMVSPIIEQFGARGIEYLVMHPPEDPTKLGEYQQDVLETLRSQTL